MAKHRWTMEELHESTDSYILRMLVEERLQGLTPYTPLARRLVKIYNRLYRQPDRTKAARSARARRKA